MKKSQENHHPEIGFAPKNIGGKTLHNVVVHYKFKYNGAQWMGFGFSDKKHVARVLIKDSGFELPKNDRHRPDHQK